MLTQWQLRLPVDRRPFSLPVAYMASVTAVSAAGHRQAMDVLLEQATQFDCHQHHLEGKGWKRRPGFAAQPAGGAEGGDRPETGVSVSALALQPHQFWPGSDASDNIFRRLVDPRDGSELRQSHSKGRRLRPACLAGRAWSWPVFSGDAGLMITPAQAARGLLSF